MHILLHQAWLIHMICLLSCTISALSSSSITCWGASGYIARHRLKLCLRISFSWYRKILFCIIFFICRNRPICASVLRSLTRGTLSIEGSYLELVSDTLNCGYPHFSYRSRGIWRIKAILGAWQDKVLSAQVSGSLRLGLELQPLWSSSLYHHVTCSCAYHHLCYFIF